MSTSEIRKEAREALKGKWGKAVCIVLAFMLITFAIGFVEGLTEEGSLIYTIINLVYSIISVPLSFGLIISFIKLKRGEDVKAFEFLSNGFTRFGKSWGIAWHVFVRMLLPIACIFLTVLLIIALNVANSIDSSLVLTVLGILLYLATLIYVASVGLSYSLVYPIAYDNAELSSKDCVKKSEELMKGNRGNYFLLLLSFIGWAILVCFTLGIGMLWLAPYISVAEICFYDRLAK